MTKKEKKTEDKRSEKTQKHYCNKCVFNMGEINLPNFCRAGYKQNPADFKATLNVARFSGAFQICPNNPFRKKVFRKMGIILPENPYETLVR